MLHQSADEGWVSGHIRAVVVNAGGGIDSSFSEPFDRGVLGALEEDHSRWLDLEGLQEGHLLQCLREAVHDPAVDLAVGLAESALDDTHDDVVGYELSVRDGLRDDGASLCLLGDLVSQELPR